jgi:hypothetical protein
MAHPLPASALLTEVTQRLRSVALWCLLRRLVGTGQGSRLRARDDRHGGGVVRKVEHATACPRICPRPLDGSDRGGILQAVGGLRRSLELGLPRHPMVKMVPAAVVGGMLVGCALTHSCACACVAMHSSLGTGTRAACLEPCSSDEGLHTDSS